MFPERKCTYCFRWFNFNDKIVFVSYSDEQAFHEHCYERLFK